MEKDDRVKIVFTIFYIKDRRKRFHGVFIWALFGEKSLKHAVKEFIAHYNHERYHQGMGNELLFPDERTLDKTGKIVKDERLGGLLNYYYRKTG